MSTLALPRPMVSKMKLTKQNKSIWGRLAGALVGGLFSGWNPATMVGGSQVGDALFKKGGRVKVGSIAKMKSGGMVKGSKAAKLKMQKVRAAKK